MAPISDKECFHAISKGGTPARQALGTLYDQHARKFLAHLRRKGFSTDNAEDILQEVFLRIARLGANAAAIEHPRAYMWRALENCATDLWRSKAKSELSESDLSPSDHAEEGFTMDQLPGTDDDDADNAGFVQCFEHCLEAYFDNNPEGATAIKLAVIEGFSGQELAEALGRSYGAAREFLSQCRKRFSALLMELCYDYIPESQRTT